MKIRSWFVEAYEERAPGEPIWQIGSQSERCLTWNQRFTDVSEERAREEFSWLEIN
jgi:hypothetical protein